MKKGFTIIELLVASLLLGMLVTILTMIFNQSSIAWRTGIAGEGDLNKVRRNVALTRDEADNLFIENSRVYHITSIWDQDGVLKTRACDAEGETGESWLNLAYSPSMKPNGKVSVGSGKTGSSAKNYTVNVMSAGPDKQFDTYDDIWSFPDDFE